MPEILLGGRARRVLVFRIWIAANQIAGVAAADARGLHAARRSEIRGAEADALHARARRADFFDVGDALRGLEDRVDEDRALEPRLGFELGEQLIDVVDVPGAFDLRDHDDVELGADGRHDAQQVVEPPRTVEAVHPHPELAVAEIRGLRDLDHPLAGFDLLVGADPVLEVREQHVELADELRNLFGHARIAGIEEVDHPRGAHRDFDRGHRCADGQGLGEVARISHEGLSCPVGVYS